MMNEGSLTQFDSDDKRRRSFLMTPQFKLSVVFVSTLLTLMLLVGSLIGKGQESDGAYRPLAVYTEVLAKIKSDYVEEPNMEKVTNGALQGTGRIPGPPVELSNRGAVREGHRAPRLPGPGKRTFDGPRGP